MRFKKIGAALLACAMCFGVFSTTAFAYVDESVATEEPAVEEKVPETEPEEPMLCNWFIALGHWRICDLLHCKGFVAVPAYSCGSWNCDNSSGVLARLGCYESREYWRKSGSIYQVIR